MFSGEYWKLFKNFFSLLVLLKLLKHVKLIIFENNNECKTKHLFLIKNEVTRFDKRMATWRKKSIHEEKYLLLRTLKKKPEDSKKTITLSLRNSRRILSMRNLKKTLITVKPKDNAINGDPQELQYPQWLSRRKLTLFGFLIMLYHKVDDRDKFSNKNYDLGRLRVHAISHLKVSPVLARGS